MQWFRRNNRQQRRGAALLWAWACWLGVAWTPAWTQDAAAESPWEEAIRAFEKADREAPPPRGAILFVGSSSIRLWDLEQSFADVQVINRGFGGSEISDSIAFASRIVFPYRPREIVLYAGDNDVAGGKAPERVFEDFKTFAQLVRGTLPGVKIHFISIKPSIKRWRLVGDMRRANSLIRAWIEEHADLSYIDIDTPMIGADGRPRADLLAADELHLSPAGYRLWTTLVRSHLTVSRRLAPPPRQPLEEARLRPMEGAVVEFPSPLYGDRQPFAICATDVSSTPKPLIVELIPGTLGRIDRVPGDCERVCEYARKQGLACVSLRPGGRGNGSVYQGYGEVDVYEAIEAARQLVAIDPERITVTGVSMGGAATWYHASHAADFWAAAAPFCGYCDYKLWEKPGGTTFHRQPWEEFSWVSRGAAYRVENLRHVPLRITHGEWDRAVGGGVPVEHSRQMARKLSASGSSVDYVEVAKTGHSCRLPHLWEETIVWLLGQRRVAAPAHVTLVVHTLRHARSFWVSVAQQQRSGAPSKVEARFVREAARLHVTTENVRRLELGPLEDAEDVALQLDTTALGGVDLSAARGFRRQDGGAWVAGDGDAEEDGAGRVAPREKRPGLSGPFGDLFYAPTVIVYGASGSDAELEFNRLMAGNLVRFYNTYNGGVHRGGITGDNTVPMPIVSDAQWLGREDLPQGGPIPVTRELLERANLFVVGNRASNAVFDALGEAVALHAGDGALALGRRTYRGEGIGCYALFPHPDGKRYVALLSGNTPDAITWGSHVGIQLLPDYLVFQRGDVLDWGFWDNAWR